MIMMSHSVPVLLQVLRKLESETIRYVEEAAKTNDLQWFCGSCTIVIGSTKFW